jgi:hypothetical protein
MLVWTRIRAAADRVTARLTLVGADPDDDEDLRARKALLVLISVLILPVAALWGALYLAFGSPVGVVPLVYFGILRSLCSRARATSRGCCGWARSTSCSRRHCR